MLPASFGLNEPLYTEENICYVLLQMVISAKYVAGLVV
jgi:hypothetical protein